MQDHYDLLGLAVGATPTEIKSAYHAKLREFPAHKQPQEFKAIRAAYEALRQGEQQPEQDFFELQPCQQELDAPVVTQLRARATAQAQVTLTELVRLTF
ncbi:DnaJ domain-containing protein [Acaryochloris marina]|uniref:J domain-containing protein n=1 Tax=Acaryochloris marina TaxID=155978 RepID=UPI001BAEDBBF|nr:DnaJ domain-containing protein [Acaryochloris marina]QUY40391.1 DnaJ domain-containing protein [Acaryochloris marina S15]